MDNREFSKVLLFEATELLNESTRQDREAYKRGEKNSTYWGKEAAKEEAIGKKLVKDANDLNDEADKAKWYKVNTKKDLRNKADEINDKAGDHYGNAHTARYNGRVASKKSQNESISGLLIAAYEILTEAGARQKYIQILSDKHKKVYDDIEENSKKLSKEPMKRELYGKDIVKSYVDEAKMRLKDKKLNYKFNKLGKEAEKYSARADKNYVGLSKYEDEQYGLYNRPVSKSRDKKAKEAFARDFGGKKPYNAVLHDRINERGEKFKSQHESIAVLLTEAALLLNDED